MPDSQWHGAAERGTRQIVSTLRGDYLPGRASVSSLQTQATQGGLRTMPPIACAKAVPRGWIAPLSAERDPGKRDARRILVI